MNKSCPPRRLRGQNCSNDGDYEDILKKLADDLLDADKLAELDKEPKVGSIYKCDGNFRFVEYDDDWEDD